MVRLTLLGYPLHLNSFLHLVKFSGLRVCSLAVCVMVEISVIGGDGDTERHRLLAIEKQQFSEADFFFTTNTFLWPSVLREPIPNGSFLLSGLHCTEPGFLIANFSPDMTNDLKLSSSLIVDFVLKLSMVRAKRTTAPPASIVRY